MDGGLNTYLYADGNPLTRIDLTGLMTWEEIGEWCRRNPGECVTYPVYPPPPHYPNPRRNYPDPKKKKCIEGANNRFQECTLRLESDCRSLLGEGGFVPPGVCLVMCSMPSARKRWKESCSVQLKRDLKKCEGSGRT